MTKKKQGNNNRVRLTSTLRPEVMKRLKKEAEKQQRSVSNLLDIVLDENLPK